MGPSELMSLRLSLCAIALLFACSSNKSEDKPAAGGKTTKPAKAKAAAMKLTATLNGKPISYVAAYAYTRPYLSKVHIRLLTKPGTCAMFTKWDNVGKGVTMLVQPKLEKSGALGWKITEPDEEKNGISDATVDSKRGKTTSFVLRYDVKDPKPTGGSDHIKIAGTVVAKGCGELKLPPVDKDVPKPRPQKLQLQLAGRAFTMRGARFRRGGAGASSTLELSTSPLHCTNAGVADLSVHFELSETGLLKIVAVSSGFLEFMSESSGDELASWKIAFKNLKGTGPVTGTVTATTVASGLKLGVAGSFSALRCPTQ